MILIHLRTKKMSGGSPESWKDQEVFQRVRKSAVTKTLVKKKMFIIVATGLTTAEVIREYILRVRRKMSRLDGKCKDVQ